VDQYVEFLRAKRALFIIAIVIGVIVAIAVAMRLYSLNGGTPGSWIDRIQYSPTAHVTKAQLPDGSERVVVDDPAKRTHAVIVRKGRSFVMDLTEPSGARTEHGTVSMGNFSVSSRVKNGVSHTVVSYQPLSFPLGWLFLFSLPIGLLAASLLGGPLAKENGGHLELAWTKPVSRDRYALSAIGIDSAAIAISQLAGIVGMLLCMVMFTVPKVVLTPPSGLQILLAFLGPFAWYAMLTGISASLRRVGLVVGLSWLFAPNILGVAQATAHSELAPIRLIHAIAQGVAYLDPIAYLSAHTNFIDVMPVGTSSSGNGVFTSLGPIVGVLFVLSLLYIAAAVVQWRRVEA